jgi:hypothetical protein
MSEPVTTDPATAAGREATGTFATGNQFGRGNPFARKVAAFRAALMEAVTEQDIKDIACKLRDDAKAGDKAATRLLFQYVIGKPQPAVDPDTLDAQEMRAFAANSLPSEAIEQLQQSVPLGWLTQVWPLYFACMEKQCAQHLGDLFARADAREERRAERAREKAERKQRRDDALRAQPPAPDDAEAEAEPLANGESNDLRDGGPSTTVEFADEYLAMVKDWLRGRFGPPNGDARN